MLATARGRTSPAIAAGREVPDRVGGTARQPWRGKCGSADWGGRRLGLDAAEALAASGYEVALTVVGGRRRDHAPVPAQPLRSGSTEPESRSGAPRARCVGADAPPSRTSSPRSSRPRSSRRVVPALGRVPVRELEVPGSLGGRRPASSRSLEEAILEGRSQPARLGRAPAEVSDDVVPLAPGLVPRADRSRTRRR